MKIAHFTICSRNYLAYALTLRNSLADADPDAEFFIVLCDEKPDSLADEIPNLIGVKEIDIGSMWSMATIYNVMEFNTAIKPFVIQHFLDGGYDAAMYIDPDIYVLRPLTAINEALQAGASAVLTPHLRYPYADDQFPSEENIMQTGIYNLGFGAFTNHPRCRVFVDWWAEKCINRCIDKLEVGLFVDQKFCDLVPAWVPGTKIIDHPGYNAAYWNLHERPVENWGDEGWQAGGEPLHFFHFSGVVPSDYTIFSKHQDRFQVDNIGALAGLLEQYLDALAENGHAEFSKEKYYFDYFRDGSRVPYEYRLLCREDDIGDEEARQLFETSDHSRFVLAQRELVQPELPNIPRVVYKMYERRGDVQGVFSLDHHEGRRGLLEWFCSSGAAEHKIPTACIDAVKQLMDLEATLIAQRAGPEQVSLEAEAPLETVDVGVPSEYLSFDELPAWTKWANRLTKSVVPQPVRRKLLLQSSFVRRSQQPDEPNEDQSNNVPSSDAEAGSDDLVHIETELLPQTVDLSATAPEAALGYIGYFHKETGVAEGARRAVTALKEAGVEVWTKALRNSSRFAGGVDFPVSSDVEWNPHQITITHINADETCGMPAKIDVRDTFETYRIGYWAWELAQFPDAWRNAFDYVDEIWTPSNFVAKAVQGATQKPVKVIPHPLVMGAADPDRDRFGIPQDSFAVLMTFDFNSFAGRKNPTAAIAAFKRAFPARDDVRLVIKVHGSSEYFNDERTALYNLVANDERLIVIDEVLTRAEMDCLQESSDAFISLHRSEGFGLNIFEMIARGKPTVATGYSGNTDFMDAEGSYLVSFDMVSVGEGEYPHSSGQYWAEPSVGSAANHLRKIEADYEAARKHAKVGQTYILENFSSAVVGKRMNDRISQLLRDRH